MEHSVEAMESVHFLLNLKFLWKLPQEAPSGISRGNFHYHFRGSFQGAAFTSTGFHVVPPTSNFHLLCPISPTNVDVLATPSTGFHELPRTPPNLHGFFCLR